MNEMREIINTCYIDSSFITLAFYSHLIPIFFALGLGFLVFLKAKKSVLSKVFFVFSILFSTWLVGDLVTWTSNNYYLIYASWSTLVYLEILFYVLGFYFASLFVRKTDLALWHKILLFLATLVPFYLTVTSQSVTEFYQPVCEASNNLFLDQYKLYLEGFILVMLLGYILKPFFIKKTNYTKQSSLLMLGSMFLALGVFSIAEYLAASTGNYELHLYSLFIVPAFLIAITYSIFNLDVFNLKIVSTYFLVFGFVIISALQFFFVSSKTDRLLTIITMALSISLIYLLFKNLKRESDQRERIEKLNVDLQNLIQQRESLVHLITHKVKGSFTRTKYVFAEMLNDTFGVLTPEMRKMAQTGLESDDTGIKTIDLVLNASNLQSGTVKYEMKSIDLKNIVENMITELKISAEAKNLKVSTDIKEGSFNVKGDEFWMKEVIHNFIENSIKYTPNDGEVKVGLENKDGKVLFSVSDNGVGITPEDMSHLFTEGGRGKESTKMNVDSTGYGLYSAKLIVGAHGGKVWAQSEGKGKGSKFYAEFQAI